MSLNIGIIIGVVGGAPARRMPTLADIRPGGRARICGLLGRGPLTQRLLEMGLIEGAEVEVVRLAPLGDPMELRIAGYALSLRRTEAAAVEVVPCP